MGNLSGEMETLLKDVSNGKAKKNKKSEQQKTMVPEMKSSAYKTGSLGRAADWTSASLRKGQRKLSNQNTQRKEQDKQKGHPRAVDNVKGQRSRCTELKSQDKREGGRRKI